MGDSAREPLLIDGSVSSGRTKTDAMTNGSARTFGRRQTFRFPERSSPEPILCDVVRVGTKEVELWNDGLYQRVRDAHHVPDEFLQGTVDISSAHMMPNEGKGGSPLYMTDDRMYIVKEISAGDHHALLAHVEAYVERMVAGSSLLCPIYLHFRDPSSEKLFIAMRNLLPQAGPWTAKYDLKGCADDKTLERDGRKIHAVHKRCWYVTMWCSCNWTPERVIYKEGKVSAHTLKIDLPEAVRDEVLRDLRLDADWLSDQGLMDYSLLIGIRRFPVDRLSPEDSASLQAEACAGVSGTSHQPVRQFAWLVGDEVIIISVGIIDFLQTWTFGKKVARVVKMFECNKSTIPPCMYSARFQTHLAERFRSKDKLRRLSEETVAKVERALAAQAKLKVASQA